MMEQNYDYIIIGAGSAGCVIANRLTASGKHTVLLIEAGPEDKNPWMNVPLAMMRVLHAGTHAWYDPTLATQSFGGRSISLPQGKTLGGGSAVNGMLYVRGQKEDYDGWRDAGCPGWGWDDVLPYFKKSECLESGGSDLHHGRNGELKLSWVDNLPAISRSAMKAAEEYGLEFNDDINSGNQDGVGYLLATIYGGRRQSTAKAFLHPIRNQRQNLTVVTETQVQKILISEGRATGLRLRTPAGEQDVSVNNEIILSAGTVGSAHILQHSGIGDPEHLKSVGVTPTVESPEVGHNLQDHIFGHLKFGVKDTNDSINYKLTNNFLMAFEAFKWLFAGGGVLSTSTSHFCGFFKSDDAFDRTDLQLAMRPFSIHLDEKGAVAIDKAPGITLSAIQTRPYSRGIVKILSNDPAERAQVDMNYLHDERDVVALVNGMKKIREIAKKTVFGSAYSRRKRARAQ